MAPIKVQIAIVEKKITLQFDARTAGLMIIMPATARRLAARLHAAADRVEPRTNGNGRRLR